MAKVRAAVNAITKTDIGSSQIVNIFTSAISEGDLSHVTYDGLPCTDLAFVSDGSLGNITCTGGPKTAHSDTHNI